MSPKKQQHKEKAHLLPLHRPYKLCLVMMGTVKEKLDCSSASCGNSFLHLADKRLTVLCCATQEPFSYFACCPFNSTFNVSVNVDANRHFIRQRPRHYAYKSGLTFETDTHTHLTTMQRMLCKVKHRMHSLSSTRCESMR